MGNGYDDARWVLARVEAKRYGDLKVKVAALEEQMKAMKDNLLSVMEGCPVDEDGHQVLPGVPDYSCKAYGRTQFFGSPEKARQVLSAEQFSYIFKESRTTVLDIRLTKQAKARAIIAKGSRACDRFPDECSAKIFADGLRAGLELTKSSEFSEVLIRQDAVDGMFTVFAVEEK